MKPPNGSTPMMHKRTNQEWLAALRSRGPAREQALADLQAHLVRAVLVYLSRHRQDLQALKRSELMQLVEGCTIEAMRVVEAKLDTFRGDSRFTTWAYGVAIKHAAGELRQRSRHSTPSAQ